MSQRKNKCICKTRRKTLILLHNFLTFSSCKKIRCFGYPTCTGTQLILVLLMSILITINFIYCDVISRCHAAWNYVLELSKEKYDANIILQILETVNKISSSFLVLPIVKKILEGFQQSSFFRTILSDFIDKITEMNSFR